DPVPAINLRAGHRVRPSSTIHTPLTRSGDPEPLPALTAGPADRGRCARRAQRCGIRDAYVHGRSCRHAMETQRRVTGSPKCNQSRPAVTSRTAPPLEFSLKDPATMTSEYG